MIKNDKIRIDMKKAFIFAALFLLSHLVGLVLPMLPDQARAANTNLIENSSLETVEGTQPTSWTANSWGTLTASLDVVTPGSDGQNSAHVTVSNYQSGDAKWYFAPVTVKPSTSYAFTDDYKATTTSEIVVQYQDANGAASYQYLGGAEATNNWKSLSYIFTTPSNAVKASVFHVIAANGELWTDTFSLSEVVVEPDTGGNLIPNASAEAASGSSAYLWSSNSWGTNTATFAHATSGQNGTRSLYAKVANYQSGDAKWYFTPVAVEASARYVFSNFYKSTNESNTFLRYEKTDGTLTYVWLGSNTASANWIQKTYSFTTPADVKNLSVFHVLSANGELWTDTYALHEDESNPHPNPSSTILNPSVETMNVAQTGPANWAHNKWGTNNATFAYVADAYTGTKALKTTVTSYTDGDAKWYFDPVELTPGKDYVFTDYYKSNVDSRIVVQVTYAEGAISYLELPGAPAATSWTKYTGAFTMPGEAKTATVYHLLSRAGALTTDDFSIEPYQAVGFTRGLVTLTFDDGWEENTTTALPIMKQHGFLSNQFYATTFIQYPSVSNHRELIKRFTDAGHEMGSHTITHPDLTTLNDAQLTAELRDSKAYLEWYLGNTVNYKINYFATPYGAYNQNVKNKIMQYYTVHRTVDAGYNSRDNFDVTRLKVQNILSTTTPAEVDAWVTKAKTEKTWLILVYHRVATDPGPYDTYTTSFSQHMQVIQNNGVPVRTMTQALSELQSQL